MQRTGDAVLRQIGQRFPDAVRQLLRRHGLLLLADQREVDPALDVCTQQTDVFQALRGSVLQQPIDLDELRLDEPKHRVHEPVLLLDLRALALQLVLGLNQLVFLRKLRVDLRKLRPDSVDFRNILHPIDAPASNRRALQPRIRIQQDGLARRFP